MNTPTPPTGLTDLERQLIAATQAGLPLVSRPYQHIAQTLGLTEATVIQTLTAMLDRGLIDQPPVIVVKWGHAASAKRVGNKAGGLVRKYLPPVCLKRWVLNSTACSKAVSPVACLACSMWARVSASVRPCTMQ